MRKAIGLELEKGGRNSEWRPLHRDEAGMTEADCPAFCYERDFFREENGVRLYDILNLVSYRYCKSKNRKELNAIYQFFS